MGKIFLINDYDDVKGKVFINNKEIASLEDFLKVSNENVELQQKLDKIKTHTETQISIIKRQPSSRLDFDEYFMEKLNSILNLIKEYEDK